MPIDENNHVNTTTEDPSTSAPVDPDVIAFPALQHGCFAPPGWTVTLSRKEHSPLIH